MSVLKRVLIVLGIFISTAILNIGLFISSIIGACKK